MGSSHYRKVISTKLRSFQRTRGIKPPAKGILIVTEGQVTEPVYFEEIKKRLALPTVELHVAGAGIGDPATLAEEALRQQKIRRKAAKNGELGYTQVADFDEIWIVFDTDIPAQHGKLNNGLRYADSKKIRCAHSTPCFEYWLLLHMDRTTAPMPKCADVIPRLSEALGANIRKTERNRRLWYLRSLSTWPKRKRTRYGSASITKREEQSSLATLQQKWTGS